MTMWALRLTSGLLSCLAETTKLRRCTCESLVAKNGLLLVDLTVGEAPNDGSPATAWTQLLLNMLEVAI